eukprot:7499770-Alexandrium_andersonii.AAC.1
MGAQPQPHIAVLKVARSLRSAMLSREAIRAAYDTQATTKVFHCAAPCAAPPCAAAMVVALASTL